MSRGAKPTTGRYNTRDELCRSVWEDYLPPSKLKVAEVAKLNGVSPVVVHKILNTLEGCPTKNAAAEAPASAKGLTDISAATCS